MSLSHCIALLVRQSMNNNPGRTMSKRIVHIVGTGTIGEPLIGLFSLLRKKLGVDEVTFHKRTPLSDEKAKVNSLIRKGATLVVDEERVADFEALGHQVSFTSQEAIERATVVIDCTPAGNAHKARYEQCSGPIAFLGQGSEYGFGQMYARGINDESFDGNNRFTHIVSCNTHNICVLIKTMASDGVDRIGLESARFICMRRSTDISQGSGFLPAPEVGNHDDNRFGTHHARDAWGVFQTLDYDLELFSSSVKLPTQYMHTLHYTLQLDKPATKAELIRRLTHNPRVALTEKASAGLIFSFGRDHGFAGRILNETVLPHQTLHVTDDGRTATGFCFTPQDGNSLLSSIAATMWYLHGEDPTTHLEALSPYMFSEI